MPVIRSSLLYAIKAFPSHKEDICRIFRNNEDFQTMCDDYRHCFEAIKNWDQSQSKEARYRKREYSQLLHELELEILRVLNESA